MSVFPSTEMEASRLPIASMEKRSIDYIPENERHGRIADQGFFWFLGNFNFFTVAIGFVGPSMGLSLGYTALAAFLGVFLGTILTACHAAQGPELGLPQMLQSRAQFGYRGMIVILLGTMVTFLGFNGVNAILLANGLHHIFGWNSGAVAVLSSLCGVLLAIYGHDFLHLIFKICFMVTIPLYIILSLAIMSGHFGEVHEIQNKFNWIAFAAQIVSCISYNVTYAPCVSDYTRYLPKNTKPSSVVLFVGLGISLSALWLITIGAWLATRMNASDGLVALYAAGNAIFHGFGILVALGSVMSLVAVMGLNTYSCMLTCLTGIDAFWPVRPTRRLRIGIIVSLALIWLIPSLYHSDNTTEILYMMLSVMLYLLMPWSAINLIDYFFVRKGQYAITDLFMPGGIYGNWDSKGLMAYGIGFIAAIPFFVLPNLYVGPCAAKLGGVDIGWLVELCISGMAYTVLNASFDIKSEDHAIQKSEKILKGLR